MGLKLITAPLTYPVTLAEMQKQCEAPETDHEDMLELCLKAATEEAEKFTGRALIDQTWDYYADAFPSSGVIQLPKPPLIEVEGVFYNSGGSEATFDPSGYIVDDASEPARITLAYAGSWPTPRTVANAVRVRFRAGYIDDNSPASENVPFAIKAAIRMIGATLFAHRETIVIGQSAVLLPWAAEQLLRRYRVEKSLA